MNPVYEKLMKCVESVRAKTDFVPKVALVLGSGLGAFGDEIKQECIIDYKDIEGFPVSTAPYHKGRFVFGYVGDVPVVVMQGRVHFYEGYPMSDVVLPARLMKLLGAEVLFLTNAAGGIKRGFKVGNFMLIRDHISSFIQSPLLGENIGELGVRFPDMSNVYDDELCKVVKKCALKLDIDLKEGVYVQTTGPQYETPTEINMFRMLGADAVGMSTVVEAIAARHMGMKVVGISCISNLAAGISPTPLTQEEVQTAADANAKPFKMLINDSIVEIAKVL
ncbi:MAG: purine-nucleoside phosphorylase [Lachnospiraceae bacterium]|nr:purine-nucleoside phosphorylase [Lachnospiraceae bacterium]